MTELDQVWSEMLGEAAARAGNDGRRDVEDYLNLKATNDAIREIGARWLFDTFVEIAGDAMQVHRNLTVERENPHSFSRGSSNMVGSLLRVRQGVRCLTVEAGWARTPSDGIMSGRALAFAMITHFGMPKAGCEFRLVHAKTLPNWLGEDGTVIDSDELRRHLNLFLGS